MKARQGISLLVLGAIHLVFLVLLIGDESTSVGVDAIVISSLVLLIIGYARAPRSLAIHSKIETLLYPFIIAFAGVLTYYTSIDLHFGPVITSTGIGFIASYFTMIFKSSFLQTLAVPIYCGTFVGMSSSFLLDDYFFVAYAGLVAGLIYILTRDALNGIGGKLGTIAFGGVVIASFIFSVL